MDRITDYDNKKAALEPQRRLVEALERVGGRGLRAGVVPIGRYKRPMFYRFVTSKNPETPFRLERMGEFPVFTVNHDLYVVVVNHRQDEAPGDFQLSYGTDKGAVIDIAPVRPTFDVKSVEVPNNILTEATRPEGGQEKKELSFDNAYVDRVLPFANKFPGETILSVSVSSYAQVVTTNKETTKAGETETELVKETKTVKILDSERWPQIHSLYYFKLSTGVIATWLREPAFARVITDLEVPNPADPDKPTPAKYKTVEQHGSVRAMPVLSFSAYITGRDVQVPWHWADLVPAPTVAFSLTSPADNFFFGGSSEFQRNVQLIYGYHLGKINQLGPQGIANPTSDAAPTTVGRFRGNAFVGLTFNVNFVRNLFGK
ncbi:MAG: hypothetical protein ABI995_00625 [Acidobacteriota bacterium]